MPSAVFLLIAAPFIGSFAGLLIDRLPRREPVMLGRSRCRHCRAVLTARDLVPVLSWVATSGQCRSCGARLGWFYPTIELAALAVAVWSVLSVPGWLAWPTAALGWTLMTLAVIDARHLLLPDMLTLPLIPAGLAVAWALPEAEVVDHLAGAVAGAASLAVIGLIFERVRRREGLGLGDVKLFAAAGAWLGWQGLPSVMLLGAASGLAAAIVRTARHGPESTARPIAFGPFLALGFWLTWLYGPIELSFG